MRSAIGLTHGSSFRYSAIAFDREVNHELPQVRY